MTEVVVQQIRPAYEGRVIKLNVERVQLPNGAVADLEIVHHPGGAAVVALDDANRVCLLRQYRYAAKQWLWELPAGKLEQREPPAETAKRELVEEAERVAQDWISLGDYFSSPGVFTEVVHLYLARGLSAATGAPEDHEVFEIHWFDLDEALAMVMSGAIRDGKTIAGLFKAREYLRSASPSK